MAPFHVGGLFLQCSTLLGWLLLVDNKTLDDLDFYCSILVSGERNGLNPRHRRGILDDIGITASNRGGTEGTSIFFLN
jgi:hypothetical protein